MQTVYMQSPDGHTYQTATPEYHSGDKRLSVKAGKAAAKAQSLEMLHKFLKPGDTVYTVLRHVSRSGMLRRIDLYKTTADGPVYLSGYAAHVLDYPCDNGIKVGGCGMDMGFHLVYALSRAMFRDNFECIGKGCPSNDHNNGSRDYTPHQHSDGGYALKHQWM